jgi:hypothetical protein
VSEPELNVSRLGQNVFLNLPTKTIAPLIVRSTAIVNAMEANKTTFPSPNPALALVTTINGLTTAETAFTAHLGTRADRDSAMKALVALVQQLHAYVQGLATANPTQAEVIAQDAAMTLRKTAVRQKSDLAVKQTVSSVVHVIAKAVKGSRAHEWQYSLDGGKTWIDVPATTKASATVTGLQPGTTVSYRQRAITTAGPGNWSQAVVAVVT